MVASIFASGQLANGFTGPSLQPKKSGDLAERRPRCRSRSSGIYYSRIQGSEPLLGSLLLHCRAKWGLNFRGLRCEPAGQAGASSLSSVGRNFSVRPDLVLSRWSRDRDEAVRINGHVKADEFIGAETINEPAFKRRNNRAIDSSERRRSAWLQRHNWLRYFTNPFLSSEENPSFSKKRCASERWLLLSNMIFEHSAWRQKSSTCCANTEP
jgi:hypothetical protein